MAAIFRAVVRLFLGVLAPSLRLFRKRGNSNKPHRTHRLPFQCCPDGHETRRDGTLGVVRAVEGVRVTGAWQFGGVPIMPDGQVRAAGAWQFGGVPIMPDGQVRGAGAWQFGGVPIVPDGQVAGRQFGGVPVMPDGQVAGRQFGGVPTWPCGQVAG